MKTFLRCRRLRANSLLRGGQGREYRKALDRLETKPFADEKWPASTLDLGQSENQRTSLEKGGERLLSRDCWVPQEPQDRCRGAQTQAGLGPRVG